MADIELPYIEIAQGARVLLLTRMPAGVLKRISYVAVRGKDDEPGAVQRVLNTRRISSIKTFTLEGGDYPGAIVLNWTSTTNPFAKVDGRIRFRDDPRSAQVIDGQHRVAGIGAAIEEKPAIADLQLSVAIYNGLTTQECADIFLSINTEQKSVPRSLVFDLYGIASEKTSDPAAVRARDIALNLHEAEDSPYQSNIKFPGAPLRKGGIALSTAVTAIKPLVEEKGTFEQAGITEFELQKGIVLNFCKALAEKYGDAWDDRSNVFLYAAGFTAAMEFLRLRIVPTCIPTKKFTAEAMSKLIDLPHENLIKQAEVKGLGGRDAPKKIFDRLVDSLVAEKDISGAIEV